MMYNMAGPTPTYDTKLWPRGKGSHATTVPKQILMIRGISPDGAEAQWTINEETGKVEVEFEEDVYDDD